jgi:hypothetical protein
MIFFLRNMIKCLNKQIKHHVVVCFDLNYSITLFIINSYILNIIKNLINKS